jgi:hypothetical protein
MLTTTFIRFEPLKSGVQIQKYIEARDSTSDMTGS